MGDMVEGLPDLSENDRSAVLDPRAADVAELAIANAQICELELLLLAIVPHLAEQQLDTIEACLSARQHALITRLLARSEKVFSLETAACHDGGSSNPELDTQLQRFERLSGLPYDPE